MSLCMAAVLTNKDTSSKLQIQFEHVSCVSKAKKGHTHGGEIGLLKVDQIKLD